ncbi:MAG: hypothetical protein CMH52_04180 [Myxococcales bacterium]|nr:hypothetical protein [Myxococcales bacterium]
MKTARRLLTVSASLMMMMFATALHMGCDEGLNATSTGSLEDPGVFSFPKVAPGASAEARVTLVNSGAGPVLLKDFAFAANTDVRDFQLSWFYGDSPDTPAQAGIINGMPSPEFQGILQVDAGDALTFVLTYTRMNTEIPSGALVMTSNDVNRGRIQIPIRGQAASAELVVVPDYVDFGRIAVGEQAALDIQISNVGVEAATIGALQVLGSASFSLSLNGGDPIQDPGLLQDPDGDGQPGLAPSGTFVLTVNFIAQFERSDRGELSIQSDAVNPDVRIDLVANGSSPCMDIVPRELEFGAGLIGRPNEGVVTIESCGAEPLRLDSIQITAGGDSFSIQDGALPDLPGLLAAADLAQDPPVKPSLNVPVIFFPELEQPYTGTLTVSGNDPQQPTVDVPLRGRGANNDCPVAEVIEDDVVVRPLDIVTLDGSASTDIDGPDGRPVAYEWVVVERPDGSTSVPVERLTNPARPAEGGPADQTSTPGAVFFVDLAGTYVIELRVTDSGGVTAPSSTCPQGEARMTIVANPDEDIHLQLVWDTPGDADQTDLDGSDVDLHFLHPRGADWFRDGGSFDCYFGNPTPDWGQIGRPEDNPSLDIDDTNGAGPENINLDSPENTQTLGGPYRVAVHYYRASVGPFGGADNWGASDATLRIYLGGVLTREFTRRLNDTNEFWEVAGIIWANGDRRVVEIDQVSERLP